MDTAEVALLLHSEQTGVPVTITVNNCLFQCCGRGWLLRAGYEQTYRGRVADLEYPVPGIAGTFKLIAEGIGTITYMVHVDSWHDVELVES